MSSPRKTLISEALLLANACIAVFKELRDGGGSGAAREDISKTLCEIVRVRSRLRQMGRGARRYSVVSIATAMGRIADAIVRFLSKYPPNT